jgi:hypothetical protein
MEQFSKEELEFIFSTQNIRFLAVFHCGQCEHRKRCDECVPKAVVSKKYEVFRLEGER